MSSEQILSNARVVTAEREFLGAVLLRDGLIAAVDEGASRLPQAQDLGGDYLLPGLVELHTDNLEKHMSPRPGVDWPSTSAVLTHDAQIVAAGITTVFDALSIGDINPRGRRMQQLPAMIEAIAASEAAGQTRAEHRLHLRCELPHHTTLPLFEKLVQREPVTLVSLMDHSPGQRQFANREKYREYYQGKYSLTDAQMQQYEEEQLALAARWSQPNRESIAALCRARQIALASHDDATHAHVAESHQLGSVIAELPDDAADLTATRRLSLAARTHDGIGFLLRHRSTSAPSAAMTRWEVAASPGPRDAFGGVGTTAFLLSLVKNRRGPCGGFRIAWSHDELAFVEADPVAVAAPPADRPADAARA